MERALCPILVARERELSRLEDALLAAFRGSGQLLAIGGDAGVGKSRLAAELQQRARRSGAVVMLGGTTEAEVSLPYLPFIEAIGNYLVGTEVDKLKSHLGPSTCRELGQLLPQFDVQGSSSDPSEPTQAKLRLYAAIVSLLRHVAEPGGVLLVLEDLHWADASTRELLDHVTRRIRRPTRILLLAPYRTHELSRRHPPFPLTPG